MNALRQPGRVEEVLSNISSALKHDDGVLLHEAGHDTPHSPLFKTQMLRPEDSLKGIYNHRLFVHLFFHLWKYSQRRPLGLQLH